jgi:hypothetical protein
MTRQIVLVPALPCFLAGILAATARLEHGLVVRPQVVLLRAEAQRQGDISAGEGDPWVDDTSRLAG